MVEHELYIAAIRRPALQKLSYEWDRSLFRVLIEFIDPVTAEVLAMTTDGLALQSMIRGRPLRLLRSGAALAAGDRVARFALSSVVLASLNSVRLYI